MAKVTAKYETIFIINANLGEEETQAIVARFRALVEANATLTSVEEWGKRRLAYPIQKQNDGYYVLMTFESKPDFPTELDRNYNITEDILRSLIVCTDE